MLKNIFPVLCFLSLIHTDICNSQTHDTPNLADTDKKILLEYVSKTIDKKLGSLKKDPQIPDLPEKIENLTTPIIIFLFNEQGGEGAKYKVTDEDLNLSQKITVAVNVVCGKWKHQPLALSLTIPYVHIMLITATHRIQNYGDIMFTNKLYEPKVTGIVFENGFKTEEVSPLDAITYDIDSAQAKNHLCRIMNIPPQQLRFEKNLQVEIYEVDHFGETYPDRKYESFFRGHKVFRENDVNHDSVMESIRLISNWFKNNVENNEPTYAYADKKNPEPEKKQDMVKVLKGIWTINKMAYFINDSDLKKTGGNCIQHYMQKYFDMYKSRKDNKLVPLDTTQIKGQNITNRFSSAGFLLLSMLKNTDRYKQDINITMQWLINYQTPTGKIRTPFAEDQFLSPGQLLLSVVQSYKKAPDEKILLFLKRSADYYYKEFSTLLKISPKNFATLSPNWFSQYFTEMYLLTKEKHYKNIVYNINDRILNWYTNYLNESIYFDYRGAIVPKTGYYGNSKITASSMESLMEAWRIAKLDNDQERMAKYKRAIVSACAYLMRLQYRPENVYYVQEKQKVIGGIKYDLIRGRIFLDNVSHTANAFMKIIQYKILEN